MIVAAAIIPLPEDQRFDDKFRKSVSLDPAPHHVACGSEFSVVSALGERHNCAQRPPLQAHRMDRQQGSLVLYNSSVVNKYTRLPIAHVGT